MLAKKPHERSAFQITMTKR